MSEVRMPIETVRDGNKITKVCVEDFYKVINRMYESMVKHWNKSVDVLDSVHKTYGEWEGELIIGTGTSQPCITDAFDEEIGNDIAFMKAKLNANLKKHNVVVKIINEINAMYADLVNEVKKIDENIEKDLNRLRVYNPDYLSEIDEDFLYVLEAHLV